MTYRFLIQFLVVFTLSTGAARAQPAQAPVPGEVADFDTVQTILQQRGWQLERGAGGDLLLRPGVGQPVAGQTETTGSTGGWSPVSIDELRALLEPHGWRVQRDQDGSILLFPGTAQTAVSQPKEPAKVAPVTPPKGDGLDQLRPVLESHGWRVERDTDGSLLLYPRKGITPPKVPTQTGVPDKRVAPRPVDQYEVLRQVLESYGWRVTRDKDGSLLLFPPATETPQTTDREQRPVYTVQSASKPVSPEPAPPPQAAGTGTAESPAGLTRPDGYLTDVVRSGKVELPIDGWEEVRQIAQAWLNATGKQGLAVGKIREVFRVYLVSIVEHQAPFALRNQIVIRRSDGRVIPLLE